MCALVQTAKLSSAEYASLFVLQDLKWTLLNNVLASVGKDKFSEMKNASVLMVLKLLPQSLAARLVSTGAQKRESVFVKEA